MASQFYAITGRRSRPTYVDEINAKAPYLRSVVQQKKDDKYNEDIYGLEKEKLAESIRSSNAALALQEKQAKKANALGVVGLGANLWLGSRWNSELKDLIEGESKSNLTGGAAKTNIGGASDVIGMKPGADGVFEAAPKTFSFDKAFTPSTYKDAVTSPSMWASGVGGGLVGAEAGEAIGESIGVGGTNERRTVGGALGGFAADRWLAGGDIYSNLFAGLVGGVTGRFSGGLF